MTRVLILVLIALAFVGNAHAAGSIGTAASIAPPRYTAREITKLHHHECNEDEYMVIPARWVNARVRYDTPDKAMCVAIESVRLAPHE